MNTELKNYTFVALDLETTGLSPITDTIIEVAAVRFTLVHSPDGIYEATDIEERSMLVHPGRAMTEEISMITGITDTMLEGKPSWWEVRDRVKEFIGDSIVVGHNVLFDIAMFATHDIDLADAVTLDTFELSEILSQDVESLNLGFLAGVYWLSAGDKEHRALGDTRLSLGLFVHYLNSINALSERKQSILGLASSYEDKKNIAAIVNLLWISDRAPLYTLPEVIQSENHKENKKNTTNKVSHQEIYSIDVGHKAEAKFLQEHIQSGESIDIAVFGRRQAEYMTSLLCSIGKSSILMQNPSEYISIEALWTHLEKDNWSRKETILILKLLFWIEDTKTGIISELKLYGEERREIEFFRLSWDEDNLFYTQLLTEAATTDVIIHDFTKKRGYKLTGKNKLILKDIALLEEAVRRNRSMHISLDELMNICDELTGLEWIKETLAWIEWLYLTFPVRPTGPEVSPPGNYGETYFLTQAEIWSRGCVILSLINKKLLQDYEAFNTRDFSITRRGVILSEKIRTAIEMFLVFHTQPLTYGVILQIEKNSLKLSYIPRSVQSTIADILASWDEKVLYGTGIHGNKVKAFLSHEAAIHNIIGWESKKYLQVWEDKIIELKKEWNLWGTVILSTSMRHIREIGKSLSTTENKILMQGISWGKGKQLSLFMRDPKNTILIGTIDTWKDEIELWNHARNIIIAKIPFDPPTDSYFLARTVGMKNNFSLYNEPMSIIKLNTLISRIYSSSYSGEIYCEDKRLINTIWWQEIMQEIL